MSVPALLAVAALAGAAALTGRAQVSLPSGHPSTGSLARSSRQRRTDAGSQPEDDESARQRIRSLVDLLKPNARRDAAMWGYISNQALVDFVGQWHEAHDDVLNDYLPSERQWQTSAILRALKAPPTITQEEARREVEQGEIEHLIERIPDEIVELFNETTSERLARAGWSEQPPSASFYDVEHRKKGGWLVHQSSANDIDQSGFRYGVQDPEGLAYTGGGATQPGPGYNFAYEPGNDELYGREGRSGRPRYGAYQYAFWVPAYVKAWHHGDREPQAIFWGPSARNIVEIGKDEDDKWTVATWDRSPKFDSSEDLVNWLDANWDQYRSILGQALDRSRRRVSRGWSREAIGERTYKPEWSSFERTETLYGDVYRGPKMGTPNQTATLAALRQALLVAAAKDTAYEPEQYEASRRRRGPLTGHCNAAAYVVQRVLGGELVEAKVHGERHVWNRLPGGAEVDLTSDQFGGDGLRPVALATKVVPIRKAVNPRFALLERRVRAILAGGAQG